MPTRLSPSKVFVPGGMPQITYVPRTGRDLENQIRSAADNLCKLVTLTGPTKSGKTVLANKVFPRSSHENIWIEGGAIDTEEDFWRAIHMFLNPDEEVSASSEASILSSVGGTVEGDASVPFITRLKANGTLSRSDGHKSTKITKPVAGLKARTLQALKESGRPLIVDDFHYVPREFQGQIVRALKPLIFEGHPVIFIAIPHRRYDAVRVEREMTARVLSVVVPPWSVGELTEISDAGFPKLDIEISPQSAADLASEAYGSPHLMQEFCKAVAIKAIDVGIDRIVGFEQPDRTQMFTTIAEATGKIIFDKLATGPRQRSDRSQRPLAGGGSADIYRVVLLALSKLGPGLEVVDYEALRAAIRQVLTDDIPQAHEVTRVLEKMAEIAAKDDSSVAVLDWDTEERRLHITDPFFAFFLKWSEGYIRGRS